MQRHEVRDVGQALAYITDCNLATVASFALLKKPPKHEFHRQINIAQQAIDWGRVMGVDFSTTRAQDVIMNYAGSVADWALHFRS